MTADPTTASIDGALAAYGTVNYGDFGGDSMSWSPGTPELVICDEGQPLWPVRYNPWRHGTYHYSVTPRTAEAAVALAATWDSFRDELDKATRALHHLHAAWRPRWHKRHCPECHPAGNPGKLCINGREYHRRSRGRRRGR